LKENQLDFLRAYDTIFVVDDSSSMNVNERPDGSMGQSRWEEARDALAGMVEIAARYDDDGVEVHFLNSERSLSNCRDPHQVKQLFDSIVPEGLTPTGTKLEMLLLQYMDDIEQFKQTRQGKEPKKRNYVVITDGAASDDPESVILATAMRLDRSHFPLTQIGIQFVQVGNDAEAKMALEELDDALQSQHSCRDIVDTVPYSGMALNSELLVKVRLGLTAALKRNDLISYITGLARRYKSSSGSTEGLGLRRRSRCNLMRRFWTFWFLIERLAWQACISASCRPFRGHGFLRADLHENCLAGLLDAEDDRVRRRT
jgi:hypothetical protein